jgi:hypothetical protein
LAILRAISGAGPFNLVVIEISRKCIDEKETGTCVEEKRKSEESRGKRQPAEMPDPLPNNHPGARAPTQKYRGTGSAGPLVLPP